MESLIRAIAENIGMDLIGVADLSILCALYEKYRLSAQDSRPIPFFKGRFSDRLYPQNEWDETRSILSFGVYYNRTVTPYADMNKRGIIAKYALGEDYHRVLMRIADAFMDQFIKSYPCRYKVFVDKGILSDRMIAYSAGLGFIGKNGFLINEEYGSFIFLGHILLDTEIMMQKPVIAENQCGDCRKCIRACPCQAYGTDGYDYTKCISYLTQKALPHDTHGYIYGCDICQNVCPFNAEIIKEPLSVFLSDRALVYPELDDVIAMDKDTFHRRYGSSALAWRGLANLKANAQNIKNMQKTDNKMV